MNCRHRNTLTLAGSTVSGVAGRMPSESPISLPNRYHSAMANKVQASTDQKSSRGCGKKETNMQGVLSRQCPEVEDGARAETRAPELQCFKSVTPAKVTDMQRNDAIP